MADKIFYISDVAEQIGKHPNTIRRWIKEGIIPTPREEWNGWRIFSEKDIQIIKAITRKCEK